MTARSSRADPAVPRVGLVVNPIAGIGGRVGLKGSDGAATVRAALERGASPVAGARATAAVERLLVRWGPRAAPPTILTGPLDMGEEAVRAAGAVPAVVGSIVRGATTARDTQRVVAALVEAGIDLLLVAGGDGTARDVCAVPGITAVPVLGIPAGVKLQSAVFATSPATAGELAADFLAFPADRRRTGLRDVLDLDEDAYRRGVVAPRLWGELNVPVERRRIQARKAPSPVGDAVRAAGIARAVADAAPPGSRLILGPGSTLRAVAEHLGVPKTLVGVDVVAMAGDGTATLVAADAGEADLLPIAAAGSCAVVVTPIGGQGFIFGRGNQPISPAVIRAVLGRGGTAALVIVATPAKLAALGARPLLVDTGDAVLDGELAGHVQVITGHRERAVARVAAA